MRLLFVTGTFPFPVTNGVAMRSAAILAALAESGHDIHLLAFGTEADAAHPEARRLCRTIGTVPHAVKSQTAKIDYWARLKVLASPLPYGTHLFRSADMRREIAAALGKDQFEAVICDTLDAMVNLPEACGVPLILNSHNAEHLILRRFAAQERNPLRWAYARLESAKLLRWERETCRRADLVLVCSQQDGEVLQAICPRVRTAVVPNVVDTRTYVPSEETGGPTLLYTGGMDWYPNRDAVEYFAFSVLPRIRRVVPEVRFVVAGRNPSLEFLRQFASIPGIEFTGTVTDMRPQIARATLCVVPLRIGSGTRLKILEAGAMGKAMVSTRLGAEGLDFAEGEEILLADDPDAFAASVIELLHSPERRRRLGAAARRRVEQSYSFEVAKSSLERALQNLPIAAAELIESGGI
jgi:glycosyltransferase involved in cell wall biosynthesis